MSYTPSVPRPKRQPSWREPLGDVSEHTGTRQDYLERYRDCCRETIATSPNPRSACRRLAPRLLEQIAEPRMLRCAWDDGLKHGGPASGPNGLHYEDLDEAELWSLLRSLSRAIQDGTYRPGGDRLIEVPKGPGRATRPLRLQNLEDRVVARAAVLVLQPLLDTTLAATSFGCRPGRDPRSRAIAYAEARAMGEHRWWWVADDVQDAFEHVPHGPLLEVLRKRLPDNRLLGLLAAIVANPRKRGLRQGNPLSPLLLNVYLDHFLDIPWQRRSLPPLLRYVDDLLILCRDRLEATVAHGTLRATLRSAGLELKGTEERAIADLEQQGVTWLGLRLKRGTRGLEARITDEVWEQLAERLAWLHGHRDASLLAPLVVRGWLSQLGPTFRFEDHGATLERLETIARANAFEELPSRTTLKAVWKHGDQRFRQWRPTYSSAHSPRGTQA